MNKKLTILVVTYNARQDIEGCLNSVMAQDYPKDLVKIIVIDNNSSDSTIGFVRDNYPQVKVINNRRNLGFAAANNQGYYLAQKQGSEYLVLLNQDTIVERDWLKELVRSIESNNKVAAVQPKILLYPEKDKINSLGNSIHFLGFAYCNHYLEPNDSDLTKEFSVPYASGAACILRLSALAKTGLFQDKFFMYHEDVDLGWRLNLAGYQVRVNPQAVIYHKYSYSKAKYKFYHMDRNRLIVLLQNYRVATLIMILPALIVMELGILFFSLKNGWFKEKIKGYSWIIYHWPTIMNQRLDVRFKIRKVKDRDLLGLFTGSIKFQEIDNWLLAKVVNPIMEAYLWVVRKVIFW